MPKLLREQKHLRHELAEVNSSAAKVLDEWGKLSGEEARVFLSERLKSLAERRANLEHGLGEIERALSQLHANAVNVQTVQTAHQHFAQVFDCLLSFEQKELVSLVLHRAEVHPREIRLGIYGIL